MIFESIYLLYFIALILFPLCVIFFVRRHDDTVAFLEKSQTGAYRGICAAIIVFGHISNHIDNPGFLKIYNPVTHYAVAVFLFLSGFAIQKQILANKDYVRNFGRKRFERIYIPWFTTSILFILLYRITDIKEILLGLLTFKSIYRESTWNWFVIALVFSYLAFYVSVRITAQKKKQIGIVICAEILWAVVCIIFEAPAHWSNNCLMFPFGMIIASYYNPAGTKIWKKTVVFFLALLVACLAYLISLRVSSNAIVWMLRSVGGLSINTALIQINQIVTVKSKVLENVGKASYETFLLGTGVFLFYFDKFGTGTVSAICLIPVLAGIIFIFYRLDNKIVTLLHHRSVT